MNVQIVLLSFSFSVGLLWNTETHSVNQGLHCLVNVYLHYLAESLNIQIIYHILEHSFRVFIQMESTDTNNQMIVYTTI